MAFHLSKRISLFATTVFLATVVPSLAFAAPAKNGTMSQPHSNQSSSVAPSSGSKSQQSNLSSKQQREIEAVLTKTQRSKFEQAMRGKKLNPALESLKLTTNQKTRINSILQASNQKTKGQMTTHKLQQSQNHKNQMHH